jgi:hypothetical protein
MMSFSRFFPGVLTDEESMEMDIDPEEAIAIMEAMGEQIQEKLLDAEYFNRILS